MNRIKINSNTALQILMFKHNFCPIRKIILLNIILCFLYVIINIHYTYNEILHFRIFFIKSNVCIRFTGNLIKSIQKIRVTYYNTVSNLILLIPLSINTIISIIKTIVWSNAFDYLMKFISLKKLYLKEI